MDILVEVADSRMQDVVFVNSQNELGVADSDDYRRMPLNAPHSSILTTHILPLVWAKPCRERLDCILFHS